MQDFSGLLHWLAAGGSVAVTAWFASWLLEDLGWWQRIRSQYKKLLILAFALCIGVGARVVQQLPVELAGLRPYLDTALLVVLAWVATQVAHKADVYRPAGGERLPRERRCD